MKDTILIIFLRVLFTYIHHRIYIQQGKNIFTVAVCLLFKNIVTMVRGFSMRLGSKSTSSKLAGGIFRIAIKFEKKLKSSFHK